MKQLKMHYYRVQCRECGHWFAATRPHAQTGSVRCRKARSRRTMKLEFKGKPKLCWVKEGEIPLAQTCRRESVTSKKTKPVKPQAKNRRRGNQSNFPQERNLPK